MAQVGVQQPTNLMEMFSSPSMMLGDIAAQQVNDQTLGNLLNRQQAAQSMDIEQQKLPFELAQLGLQNQETQARIPGVQAQSGILQNNYKVDSDNLGLRTKADAAKKLADISDSEWTQHMNAIQQAMSDPSPQVRAVAGEIYKQLPEMVKLREQAKLHNEGALAVEEARGKNQRELEDRQAEHGKYLKRWSMGVRQNLMFEGDPIKKDALIRGAIAQAQRDGNQDGVEEFTGYLSANKPAYDNAMKAKMAAQAGKPNAAELAGLPAVDIPQAQPPAGNATPEAPEPLQITPASITKAFGAYEPNKYQYRINPATGKLQRAPL